MVQRKDSITYIEFIRGKYNLNNVNYIEYLFQNMTVSERNTIKNNTIEELWKMLWKDHVSSRLNIEFKDSKIKFYKLKNGYLFKRIKNQDENLENQKKDLKNQERDLENQEKDLENQEKNLENQEKNLENQEKDLKNQEYVLENIDLVKIINKVNIEYPFVISTDFEFPKGRRNLNESDINCAFREFEEESGVNSNKIILCNFIKKPMEEVFLSLNKIRYRHIYYLAYHKYNNMIMFNKDNKIQCKEVKDVQWFTYDEIIEKIRDIHIQRIELFKRVNRQLLSNINNR